MSYLKLSGILLHDGLNGKLSHKIKTLVYCINLFIYNSTLLIIWFFKIFKLYCETQVAIDTNSYLKTFQNGMECRKHQNLFIYDKRVNPFQQRA